MQLYYFTGQSHALDNIAKRRLKISRLNAVNDPFEFLGPVFETREERVAMRNTKRQLGEKIGLICFSTDWQHPLLWGHYADKCHGVCYGFNTVGKNLTVAVRYHKARPNLSRWGIAHASELTQAHMEEIHRMKFSAWRYEKERRLFCQLKDEEGGHFFLDFAPALKLNKVIVGCESGITRAQVVDVLGGMEGVEVFKARPAFHEFKMTPQRDFSMW